MKQARARERDRANARAHPRSHPPPALTRPPCPRVQAKVVIEAGADAQGARNFIGSVGGAWLGAVVLFGGIAVLNGVSS